MFFKISNTIQYIIFTIPITGVVLAYLYIFWVLNFTTIYPNDSQALGVPFLYNIINNILMLNFITIFLWLPIGTFYIYKYIMLYVYKKKFVYKPIAGIYYFLLGSLLFWWALLVDPGGYFRWFLD